MKTLSIITVAILLGLSGAAMAGVDSQNQQSNTNRTGPNPYMPEFSTSVGHGDGSAAFAQYPVHHHVVNKK